MEIRIKTSDYEITREVSDYLDDKLAQIEKILGDDTHLARCEVELGRATGRHKHSDYQWFAEIQIIRPGQARVVASNHEATINAAIDMAKEELMHQIRRERKLHIRMWRRSGSLAKRLMRLE